MRKKLGLSGKLVLMILFSALASAVFLVGMQVVLNKALWLYFDQPETQQRAVEKQVQELQSYIDRRGLSSRDIDKLDDWSVRNGSTMFIIYDRSRMLYSSYPLVAPVYEGRENVTETVPAERWLPMYSLTFSDKETTAMFYYNGVDAYYGKGCEILLFVSFALFPLFFFLSSRKIIRYILLLSGEIQAMEGGDLDHSITIQGDDELALLATSLDGLRLTLRQQQAEEAQAAAKVKSLITEMSHDLRTPLTTLLLYTEILRHHKYETEAQEGEYLAKIDGKARQIKQLSDNLFEYALVTRDTVVQLDAPARFSQIFEEPLAEMVEMLQQRGFACALELGSEDVLLTVRAQYIRRILDNIGSNLIKYADPARPIEVRFLRQEGRAGLVFRNHVLPAPPAVESTKVGLTSIETMMDKMHADCKIEQENEQFTMTLLFPVE
jgi:signal transduction histidine kinase